MYNTEYIKKLLSDRFTITKKWQPICGNLGLGANDCVIELYCLLFEYRELTRITVADPLHFQSTYVTYPSHSQNINSEIIDINSKIRELDSIRVKCEGSELYYNILDNNFEYKLDNGQYIGTDREKPIGSLDIQINHILSAFPDDFIKMIDMIEYRDKKLNSLI